jgi:hypothetical protein
MSPARSGSLGVGATRRPPTMMSFPVKLMMFGGTGPAPGGAKGTWSGPAAEEEGGRNRAGRRLGRRADRRRNGSSPAWWQSRRARCAGRRSGCGDARHGDGGGLEQPDGGRVALDRHAEELALDERGAVVLPKQAADRLGLLELAQAGELGRGELLGVHLRQQAAGLLELNDLLRNQPRQIGDLLGALRELAPLDRSGDAMPRSLRGEGGPARRDQKPGRAGKPHHLAHRVREAEGARHSRQDEHDLVARMALDPAVDLLLAGDAALGAGLDLRDPEDLQSVRPHRGDQPVREQDRVAERPVPPRHARLDAEEELGIGCVAADIRQRLVEYRPSQRLDDIALQDVEMPGTDLIPFDGCVDQIAEPACQRLGLACERRKILLLPRVAGGRDGLAHIDGRRGGAAPLAACVVGPEQALQPRARRPRRHAQRPSARGFRVPVRPAVSLVGGIERGVGEAGGIGSDERIERDGRGGSACCRRVFGVRRRCAPSAGPCRVWAISWASSRRPVRLCGWYRPWAK